MNKYYLLLLLPLLVSCGGGRGKNGVSAEIAPTLSDTLVIITADSHSAGVRYIENRAIDTANPPLSIDFSKENYDETSFDISKYTSSVEYLIFSHPHGDSALFFKGQTLSIVAPNSMSTSNYSVSVRSTATGYFINDLFSGLHMYDNDGKFVESVITNTLPYKTSSYDIDVIEVNSEDLEGFAGVINWTHEDNIIAYLVRSGDNKIKMVVWYDIIKKREVMKRLMAEEERYIATYRISDSIYISAVSPFADEPVAMRTFNVYGDTLCLFSDHTPRAERPRGSYVPPESPMFYFLGNDFHIRFPYNDTIFILSSASRVLPKYVVDMGEKRVDVKSGMRGGQHGKLMPDRWIETDSFILFSSHLNHNSINGRREGYVRYYYKLYDKRSRKVNTLPSSAYPEDFLIDNALPDGIPFYFSELRYSGSPGNFSILYGKKDLKKILNDKSFGKLPDAQKSKVKELYDSLSDGELLLMVIR